MRLRVEVEMQRQRHEAQKLCEGKGRVNTGALKNNRNVAMDVLNTHSADRDIYAT